MNMSDFIEVLQEKKIPYSIDGDKIFVDGNLNLRDTSITSLPDNLNVSRSLDLENTCITRLPNNLKVGGFIYLHPEKIINIAYRKFLRNGDYTVFAAWINGECCIVVNSMIYTLGEFFHGLPTTDVTQAARECVSELAQRWKGTGCSTTWINVSDCLPELDTPVLGCWFSDNGNFVLGCYVRTYSADAGGWVWATAEDFGDGHWLFDDDYPIEFWMPLPGKPELVGGAE